MSTGATIHRVDVAFDDNRLVPLLFGEHDAHLARIERQLGVSLQNRGNTVTIAGAEGAVTTARAALEALWDRLRQGQEVDVNDIDTAVRMAAAPAESGRPADKRQQPLDSFRDADTAIRTPKRILRPRSPRQAHYIDALERHPLVFGLGPAGTGKTFLAVAMAVQMYLAGKVERVILSRPAVEAGEKLGFLPGDLKEKVDPYLRPLFDALYETLPGEQVQRRLETGEFEIAPLAFMRGRTLSNAFVILDEGQNTSVMQMKMFLTRLGENARMAVTGDLSQTDLPPGQKSGLADAVDLLTGIEGIAEVRFTDADVVRHDLVTRIVQAYEARAQAQRGEGEA